MMQFIQKYFTNNYPFFFLALLFLAACEKKNGALNRKEEDFGQTQSKVITFSVANGDLPVQLLDNVHLNTDDAVNVLLGNYQDPVLGAVRTRFYAALQTVNYFPENLKELTVDSVELYLVYTTDSIIYGAGAAPQIQLAMYTLAEKLESADDKRYTYLDSVPTENTVSWVLNTNPIALNPKDSVTFTLNEEEKKYPPLLRVPLNKTLGEIVFEAAKNEENPFTQAIFDELFPGFLFEALNDQSGVAAINIQSPLSVVRIFYTDPEAKAGFYDIALYYNKSRFFTQVQRPSAQQLGTKYAFMGSGLGLEVDFSSLKDKEELRGKVINQAVLYLTVPQPIIPNFPFLSSSVFRPYFLNTANEDDEPSFELQPFPSRLPFIPVYNADLSRYEFYITGYISDFLRGTLTKEKLFFASAFLSNYRSLLIDNAIELRIIYSEFTP